jgi:hypothetical protein
MKIRLLAPLFAIGLGFALQPAVVFAQDQQPEVEEKSAEEHKADDEKAEKEDKEKVTKMMKVFKALEGEWTGKEKVEYNNEIPGQKNKPDAAWDDTWKGFFTQNGRYFEMEGATSGALASTYKWVVTYDSGDDIYKAWSFGTTGFSEYTGELSDDKKSVIWTSFREGENFDMEDTFEFQVDGNSCKASGENVLKFSNGGTINYSTHTSSYTRKKVEI